MYRNIVTTPKIGNIKPVHKWTSTNIRKQFLDYFINENGHHFVRSSPVVPFCDPTVPFVNAGMNQFKSIFLGHQKPTVTRIANSQKCVRVGGKHNDLSVVGTDGYHHTFFEMLGNWSFGDYFKKDACTLAWNLLTGPYGIKPSSLYITYFGGDQNLEADLECKDIWRSLGVSEDRIIPFGLKDNFWEMGLTGPCGPCTEIHVDRTNSQTSRSLDVNKDLPDLTELWNIVFIQYHRDEKGQIHPLPQKHIDTGMGFERLTAVLQDKFSNYDTDVFTDMFDIIKKNCKGLPNYEGKFGANDPNEIDISYRILVDHARAVTICLADGMIPEQNQKLRKILRKCLFLCETTFKNENLLKELSLSVAQKLGDIYPELHKNINQVKEIILCEKDAYKSLRSKASKSWSNASSLNPALQKLNILEMPGLVAAYDEIQTLQGTKITPELAFKLYDTYGLDEETISSLSEALNLSFDANDLKTELENAKLRTKQQYALNNNLTKVLKLIDVKHKNDNAKYNYARDEKSYKFNELNVEILNIISEDKLVDEIQGGKQCYLILNKTNLYAEEGGQISDKGMINFDNKYFLVTDIINIDGHLLHKGILKSNSSVRVGENGVMSVDAQRRISLMANHSATHLLNAAVKKILNATTCQKSSAVHPEYLSFDVGVYSNKPTAENITDIEAIIRNVIKNNVPVKMELINSQQLLQLNNVTLIPGEVYPENGIRLININDKNSNLFSCEPCCGTHVLNSSDLVDFCITNCKSLGRSTVSFTAVTREQAVLAHKNGESILNQLNNIQENISKNIIEHRTLDEEITKLQYQLIHNTENENIIPFHIKIKCLNIIDDINKKIRGAKRGSLKELIKLEMKNVLSTNMNETKNNQQFIVHFLDCSKISENIELQHATKLCKDTPVIVLSYSESMAKARCCVPKHVVSEDFNAELWLSQTVGSVFRSSCSPPRGQNSHLVCNMKAKKVNSERWEMLLSDALNNAKQFAYDNL